MVAAKPEAAAGEKGAPAAPKPGRKRVAVLGGALAAVLVLGVGGFVAYIKFLAPPPPPPPPPAKAKGPAPAPTSKTPSPTAPVAGKSQPTPSDTMNKVAQAPATAINKAQDAIAARQASGQTNVAPADVPGKTTPDATKAGAPKTKTATATTKVAPGVTATTAIDATLEASPAFTSFVASAKITGVVATRAVINGQLVRAGDVIERANGIIFEGYDFDTKELRFKDKTGARVVRRYP